MAVADGSAAVETVQEGSEASGIPSESSSTAEHDTTKNAHPSSSERESGIGSNGGHVVNENGATQTADGLAVVAVEAVAVGNGVEENVQVGEVLTAEEADKAWEQYIVQVRYTMHVRYICVVHTSASYVTSTMNS